MLWFLLVLGLAYFMFALANHSRPQGFEAKLFGCMGKALILLAVIMAVAVYIGLYG